MRVGVMTVLYHDLELTEALDRIAALGVRTVELATGNYVGNAHADPAKLLADEAALEALRDALDEREMTISALSQHGNPLHPNAAIASAHHETWRRTLELAQRLDVDTIVAFSGCPGDGRTGAAPELGDLPVAARFPRDPRMAVERARHPVLGARRPTHAARHGVRIALRDASRDDVVYNPETLLPPPRRGRRSVVACNFDPSHLFWQGIDVVEAAGDRPGRRDLPRPRQGHRPGRAQRRASTASWTPSPTQTCSTAPGSSAPSATATASELWRRLIERAAAGRLRRRALDRARDDLDDPSTRAWRKPSASSSASSSRSGARSRSARRSGEFRRATRPVARRVRRNFTPCEPL